ncbi:hypothetical protein [Gluconacetobacter diazotrophicus]|uniref:Putative membrane protein n=1 Tax=Gluconacetobacter diazotrophicus (strain ATCC 49037 / DSM 5601 / CCUG 37298 / CIP 103539 / LMG 7603 / PAl5) TaxID=272568 RepID=A9HSV4_GLUDA|nr:hypothetical protein [Gluconacetobacter diazotrophicus]CAP57835.1 putative membrane protein [Gluconacetobacter diazotrophicus PA1 5]
MTHLLGTVFLFIGFAVFAFSVVPFATKKNLKLSLLLILVGFVALGNGLLMMHNPHLFDTAQTPK